MHAKHDREALSRIFTELCSRVSDDLLRKGYRGHTIGIKLRFDNFQTVTRDMRVERATDNNLLIRRAAGQCLKRAPLDRRIRLLGVRVSGLKSAAAAEEQFSEQGSFEFD